MGRDLSAFTYGEGTKMSEDELKRLIELAKSATPSAAEQEEQRRSFAYGNTNFENDTITRELVDQVADSMRDGSSH
jgi:hypothetical protein